MTAKVKLFFSVVEVVVWGGEICFVWPFFSFGILPFWLIYTEIDCQWKNSGICIAVLMCECAVFIMEAARRQNR